MGEEAQELGPNINGHHSTEEKQENEKSSHKSWIKPYKWWLQMIIYSLFVLAGMNVGTILGRLYFDNGGKSKWMASLVQVIGFPVLFPFLFLSTSKNQQIISPDTNNENEKRASPLVLGLVYISLGVILAAGCLMYSIGLQYLPVTTYTLICASQLGFNALFSFFLNAQKFTPYIVNSLVLLTISSTLLVFQNDDSGDENKASRKKYILGFVCTLAASAGYALMLSLTQLAFQRIIKKETIREVIKMSIYQTIVASFVILVGIFASGDWRKMSKEMEGYKSGKVSYVMNLFWTAVSWQVFMVGSVGLIFKVSSLFSNVMSILGLPIAPVLAVIFLHEKLTGLKAISMVLAVWGFVSYIYQHYLDDLEAKVKKESSVDEVCLVERGAGN